MVFQAVILRNLTQIKFGKKSTHFDSKIWFHIYLECSYGPKVCGNMPLNWNILTHLKRFEFEVLKNVRALKKQFCTFKFPSKFRFWTIQRCFESTKISFSRIMAHSGTQLIKTFREVSSSVNNFQSPNNSIYYVVPNRKIRNRVFDLCWWDQFVELGKFYL